MPPAIEGMICAGRCVLERGLGPWAAACRRPFASAVRPRASWGTVAAWQTSVNLSSRLHTSARIGTGPPAPFPDGREAEKEPGGRESQRSLVTYEDLFEKAPGDSRSKATFDRVMRTFCGRDIRRRGHVEFIYTALRKMPEFGVERDLGVYNNLLDVFPKEVFVPRNYIQRMFNHYPRQQECAVQVLEQMENYGVLPSTATKALLVQIFGAKSHPMRKYQRLLYWFPRFRHVNPYPVPEPLPLDPLDLARLGLQRIAADLSSQVTVYQMPHTELGPDGRERLVPHVVGIQSPDQRDLLAQHDPQRPVFVEGPFPLWLRRTCVYYYILRSDPLTPEAKVEKTIDPERNLFYPMELTFDLDRDLGDEDELDVDVVDEGPVFAMCHVGSGDQASLSKWLSGLQATNPTLGLTPVLFRIEPGPREVGESQGDSRSDQEDSRPREGGESPGDSRSDQEDLRRRRQVVMG